MTALDRQLARTFRLARWQESAGRPVCAECFDGDDLAEPSPDPLTPGLSRYRCTVCRTEFSDTRGTVFVTGKPTPLLLWAYLVLLGDPARLTGLAGNELQRCWVHAAKIKGRTLPRVWREHLEVAGVTAERLRQVWNRGRKAAA